MLTEYAYFHHDAHTYPCNLILGVLTTIQNLNCEFWFRNYIIKKTLLN